MADGMRSKYYLFQMFFKQIIFSLTLSICIISKASGQTKNQLPKDTNIIYHISYVGGPASRLQHTLHWFTEKEIPNTYFIIEHFCWNRWIQKGKMASKGTAGKHEYMLKMPPHNGVNPYRVILYTDSNIRVCTSKQLDVELGTYPIPKVIYTDKKTSKEIVFSSETDFELYDATGKLVKEGRGTGILYDKLPEGTYTLNYDNITTTFKRK